MQAKQTIIGTFTVQYDRSEREWVVLHGEQVLERMPSGAAGKDEAIIEAIRQNSPTLHQMGRYMVLKNPLLGKRVWAAVQLVINGHVLPPRPGNLVNEVAQVLSSQDDGTLYSLQQRNNLICGCEDFQFEKAPMLAQEQRYCKHIIAYLLHLRYQKMPIAITAPAVAVHQEEMAYA